MERNLSNRSSICGYLLAFIVAGALSPMMACAGSMAEIPRGTIFKLRHELEIPANQDFLMLGKSVLHEVFNDIDQYYNANEGRYYYDNHYYPYFRYTHFEQLLYRNYRATYHDCLERHRQYWSSGGSGSQSVIVNQGDGNTNVIINNGGTTYDSGSYIGDNQCIPPSFTYSFLVIDREAADAGGIFRTGYEFKVSKVRVRRFSDYNRISILFDHDIARGVVVISTEPVGNLYAGQLEYDSGGGNDGFWAGVGAALSNMNSIAGSHFEVLQPAKKYYD